MQIDRVQVKTNAKAALKANYWPIVGWLVLAAAITSACSGLCAAYIGIAAVIIVTPVIATGTALFAYRSYLGQKAGSEEMFGGFHNMGHVIGGVWWMILFQYLWTLLFVIPGIIKGIAYSMTPFILADQPEVGAQDALKLSMAMTDGHKSEIFVMYLSFIGWTLLGTLTFGILDIFYVVPYMSLTLGGYYDELKRAWQAEHPAEAPAAEIPAPAAPVGPEL
jgi:uncharacterized membrane protein